MKTFKHLDTGGHGYLSVAKKDIEKYGISPNEFTGYSGHTLTRMYLEEDQDATTFLNILQNKGIEYRIEGSYVKSVISHNYNPELFDWTPQVGDVLIQCDFDGNITNKFQITDTDYKGSKIRLLSSSGNAYAMPRKGNIFQYFTYVERNGNRYAGKNS
jgi:hypothetical protein